MKKNFTVIKSDCVSEFMLEILEQKIAVSHNNQTRAQFEILQNGPMMWVLKDADNQVHRLQCVRVDETVWVHYKNKIYNFEIFKQEDFRRKQVNAKNTQASGQILSPMPGRIAKIEVHEGDRVVQGQGLLVMEAMKMENELKALKAGRVHKIFVKAGDTVEAKQILVEIQDA